MSRLDQSLRSLRHMFGGDHPLTGLRAARARLLRIEQGRYAEAERCWPMRRACSGRGWAKSIRWCRGPGRIRRSWRCRRGDPREAVRLATLTLEQFAPPQPRRSPFGDRRAAHARTIVARAQQFAGAERELAAGLIRARQQLSTADPRLSRFEQGLAAAERARAHTLVSRLRKRDSSARRGTAAPEAPNLV